MPANTVCSVKKADLPAGALTMCQAGDWIWQY